MDTVQLPLIVLPPLHLMPTSLPIHRLVILARYLGIPRETITETLLLLVLQGPYLMAMV
jgi:hypothetical protein